MHQRQAGSYTRRFHHGTRTLRALPIEQLDCPPGSIGLIPPEFDDLKGGEMQETEQLRADLTPP